MSSLPQPPEPLHAPGPGAGDRPYGPPPRPGQLTGPWRMVLAIGWSGVVLGLAAVWKSSRTMGLSTWWLGPTAAPQPLVVQLLPFVPAVGMAVAAMRNVRHLPHLGIAASLVLAAIGAGDLGRFPRIAWVELALAAAGLLVSIASFAGLLRATPAAAPHPSAAMPLDEQAATTIAR